MKKTTLTIFTVFIFIQSFACSCRCSGDCSFSIISDQQNFVALVKVIEYSEFLDGEYYGYDGKMPYSMTVEVVKKYKGTESRKRIKIWGDNGALCRPYISNFEVGKYYLIAPSIIHDSSETGNANDYDLFSCWTDYLEVDYEKQIAYGEYSRWQKKISLEQIRRKLEE